MVKDKGEGVGEGERMWSEANISPDFDSLCLEWPVDPVRTR